MSGLTIFKNRWAALAVDVQKHEDGTSGLNYSNSLITVL